MHIICAWQSGDSRVTTNRCRVTLRSVLTKSFLIAWNVQKRCLTVSRRSRDLRPLSRDRSATFLKIFSKCLKRPKNVVWQSAEGRVTSTTVAWPFSDFFQNFPKSLETSKKRCLTVGRRSPNLWPLSRDRSATFFKKISNCLKRPKKRCLTVGRRSRDLNHCRVTVQRLFSKFSQIAWKSDQKNVVWQSADRRVTSDHCRVTVQRLFSKNFLIAWNVEKTLFDSRPMVAWPPTTVAWPISDFFQKIVWLLETSKKRCLTVGWWSRDLRPLSRDRSATFFKIFPNRLKRPKNVVWQLVDGRVTSDHCRVTVQRLFKIIFLIAWNV